MNVTERRLLLRASGFQPIPLRFKNPAMKEDWAWQNLGDATPEQIETWATVFTDAYNTGLLAKLTPAFDIDVLIPEASAAIEGMVREWAEERGRILVRFGLRPKRLIPFRTNAPGFAKIRRIFDAPDGSEHKLEFLANGQQFAAFGRHPDTHELYDWFGGEPGGVPRDELPHIHASEALELVDRAERILVEQFGFVLTGFADGNGRDRQPGEPAADIATLRKALDAIPNSGGWDDWNRIGMALWRATNGSAAGFGLFDGWSQRSEKYDAANTAKKWAAYFRSPPTQIGAGTIFHLANEHAPGWRDAKAVPDPAMPPEPPEVPQTGDDGGGPEGPPEQPGDDDNDEAPAQLPVGVALDDLHYCLPQGRYIFAPTGELWPAKSVNACIPPQVLRDRTGNAIRDAEGQLRFISASAWLDRNQHVEQITWAPCEPMLVRDRLVVEGGWVKHLDVVCFNFYKPPTVKPGKAAAAGSWLNHVRLIYPDDAEYIIHWLAHRRQRPAEKIHALVLGGKQGIGKDTLLAPIRDAVGPWNFKDVSPKQVMGRFNGFLKSVILRISEVRDLGDATRYDFYDHLKTLTASPPETLRVDEKNTKEYAVINCCGVILTMNHLEDGIYLPEDDRRHYVAWSHLEKEQFSQEYWKRIWGFYAEGGIAHVVAYLDALDLSAFDPKAPPPKTPAFWAIVNANRAPEDAELADVLDYLKRPAAVTLIGIVNKASELAPKDGNGNEDKNSLSAWLKERKNRRIVPHRLRTCGYVPVPNPDAKDGLWKRSGARQVIYAREELSVRDRIKAAVDLPGVVQQRDMF
jgi:hypothetical protein